MKVVVGQDDILAVDNEDQLGLVAGICFLSLDQGLFKKLSEMYRHHYHHKKLGRPRYR